MYNESTSKLFKKEFKKQMKMRKLSKRMQKENKRLQYMNTELLGSIVDLNKNLRSYEDDIQGKEIEIASLKTKLDERKDTNKLTIKCFIGFVICWLMTFFMYQCTVVDHESFLVMNSCIIVSYIFLSFF